MKIQRAKNNQDSLTEQQGLVLPNIKNNIFVIVMKTIDNTSIEKEPKNSETYMDRYIYRAAQK